MVQLNAGGRDTKIKVGKTTYATRELDDKKKTILSPDEPCSAWRQSIFDDEIIHTQSNESSNLGEEGHE